MMEPVDARSDECWLRLQEERLDLTAPADWLPTPAVGGVALFVGTTRRWTGDRETVALAYECYPAMALREMARIAEEVRRRWPIDRVVLHHRIGSVPAGEASVVVGASSAHRADAFEAARFLIDTLKKDVPIWKKEQFADGTSEWVQSGG